MQHLWLIPVLPLAGFAINGILGRRFSNALVSAIGVGASLLSFLWVMKVLLATGWAEQTLVERYFTWFASGTFNVSVDLMLDRLTAVMLLVVTGIGTLIHFYSIGYMGHEGGYYRFFSFLNLFMFFMLVLVLAGNFLVMFVGWEGVGLCSYLLIGFYFLEKFAGDAAKKAFVVNRIGDFGFTLAMFLIFINFGTLDFGQVFGKAAGMPPEHGAGILTAICLLLFVGATGKSAQIPLYVWLPDAMAGPTPVSALIHAATMVTAGVYMVTRSAVLFQHSEIAMNVVAIIGLATAVLAATIGLVQNDIKKVYAYSTVSQLGYMFLGLGVGAFAAGMWHVVTHAFFKALLFLGAGSVIHALSGEQDLQKMGGLRAKAPITFWTLLAAAVAIAGVPFTSGWFSKDAILMAAHHHAPWMYWVGVITAGMTAFYVFRSIFLAFFGEYRGDHHTWDHAHESPASMWIPLAILAVLSLAGGFLNVPRFLEPVVQTPHEEHDMMLVVIASAAGIIGIFLAWFMYVARPGLPDRVADRFSGAYALLYNKYFVDEVYDATVVEPTVHGSSVILWRGFDAGLIDGIANGIGTRSRGIGNVLRRWQSGNIRSYAAWVVLGSIFVIVAMTVQGVLR
jgi:NADH-quinone oxidoreductase subunit L